MNRWMAQGLLVSSVFSISVVAMASARAAASISAPVHPGPLSAKGESVLGDLVADALRAAAKSDVALVPANILEDREAGSLTPDTLKKLITAPAAAGISVVKITGKDLRSALNRSLSLYPRKNQGFLQVSGLTVTFDPTRAEEDRIVDVKVDGESLKPDKVYTAAMPESLVKGGLGYFKLWDPKGAKSVTDAKGGKTSILDAVTQRLKDNKGAPATDGRIKAK